MKRLVDIKLVIFYLWVGSVYIFIWILTDTHKYPGTFFYALLNNLWRLPYLIVINYIFFEYAIPFVLKKRKTVIFNILLFIPMLWVVMMLWSYGTYGWCTIGLLLHILTPFITLPLNRQVVVGRLGFMVGVAFFISRSH